MCLPRLSVCNIVVTALSFVLVRNECDIPTARICIQALHSIDDKKLTPSDIPLTSQEQRRIAINTCMIALQLTDEAKCFVRATKACQLDTSQYSEMKREHRQIRSNISKGCQESCPEFSSMHNCLSLPDHAAFSNGRYEDYCNSLERSRLCVNNINCSNAVTLYQAALSADVTNFFNHVCQSGCDVNKTMRMIEHCWRNSQEIDSCRKYGEISACLKQETEYCDGLAEIIHFHLPQLTEMGRDCETTMVHLRTDGTSDSTKFPTQPLVTHSTGDRTDSYVSSTRNPDMKTMWRPSSVRVTASLTSRTLSLLSLKTPALSTLASVMLHSSNKPYSESGGTLSKVHSGLQETTRSNTGTLVRGTLVALIVQTTALLIISASI